MENVVRIDVTAISIPGEGERLRSDNFYINGRHRMEHENGSVHVTVEKDAREHILAVMEGMDRMKEDRSMSVSMVKELKKAQEKINGSDVQGRIEYIKERLDEANNVIYSMALNQTDSNEKEQNRQMSFSCLYLSGTRSAVLSSGSGSVYLLRDGVISCLTKDTHKIDRLLKMGIITTEQAKILSASGGLATENSEKGIRKIECSELRDGDVFLVCSESLASTFDNDRMYEILSSGGDSSEICRQLMQEAITHAPLTIMVVRVGGIVAAPSKTDNITNRTSKKPVRRKPIPPILGKAAGVIAVAAVIMIITIFTLDLIFADIPAGSGKSDTLADGNTNIGTGAQKDEQDKDNDNQSGNENPEKDPENTETPGNSDPSGGNGDGKGQENGEEVRDIEYTVQKGDVLGKISEKFYGDQSRVQDIIDANNLKDPDKLQIGDVLIIPGVKQ